jgi:hypothetical protein
LPEPLLNIPKCLLTSEKHHVNIQNCEV